MKKLPLFLSLVVTAFFFACGDNSASNANGTNGEGANSSTSSQGSTTPINGSEVESIKELGRCSNERDGDTVYVAEKMRDYICHNHVWEDISEYSQKTSSSSVIANVQESSSSQKIEINETSSSSSSKIEVNETPSSSSSSSLIPSSSSSSSLTPLRPYVEKGGFVTWYGDQGEYRINTGLDAGTNTSGLWYDTYDDIKGGASQIEWPTPLGEGTNRFNSVIEHCKGICGTFSLDKGELGYNPYISINFDLAGKDETGKIVATDVSKMEGICIGYSSDIAGSIEISLGAQGDAEFGEDLPFVSFPKASTGAVKEYTWSEFRQVGWGEKYITGEEAATKIVSLRFKLQARHGTTGNFNIMSIGAIGGNCAVTTR